LAQAQRRSCSTAPFWRAERAVRAAQGPSAMPPKKPPVEEPVEEKPPTPPPPEPTEDEVTELSTGLQLPLRGLDVLQIWEHEGNYDAQVKLLVELLGLTAAFPSTPQRNIVCDFYIYNLIQAKALCLTARQGAVFHAIMAKILGMMGFGSGDGEKKNPTPQDMPCGTAECFQEFQRLLLQHSVSKPPERLDVFRVSEARLLTDFASVTLFKHFLLYQFCINCSQEVQTLRFQQPLQRPLPPPDLSTARPRPRPRGWRLKGQEEAGGEAAAAGGGAGAGGGDGAAGEFDGEEPAEGGEGDEASPEEQEIARVVAEKLRETEAALQAKLDAREEAFREKIAATKGAAGKGKK